MTPRDRANARSADARAAQCDGKERFASYDAGAFVAARLHRRGSMAGRSVYRCPHCSGWHIGTASVKKLHRMEIER